MSSISVVFGGAARVSGRAAMPAAIGNNALYGGVGAGTRITLSSDLVALSVNDLTIFYS